MAHDIITRCSLFSGLSDQDLQYALNFFEASPRSYDRGTLLHPAGEPLPAFGLVLSGTVQVYCDDMDGNQMIMANVPAGETFGESLCFLRRETAVYISAVTDCSVLWLRLDGVRKPQGMLELELTQRFIAMLASRALAMNDRIQILSKLTLREKLIAFFSQYGGRGSEFTLPFRREDMALYLGTNRSALSRELSRMQREGLIRFSGNRFKIL